MGTATSVNPFAPRQATTAFGIQRSESFQIPASQAAFGQQAAAVDPNQQYVQYLDRQFSTLARQVNGVREIIGRILQRNVAATELFSLQLAEDQLEVIAADFRASVKKARLYQPLANTADAAAAGYRHQIIPLYEQVAQATMQLIQHNESCEQALNSMQKDALQPGQYAFATLFVQYGKAAGQAGMKLTERLHNLRMQEI